MNDLLKKIVNAKGFSSDSRLLQKDDVFVALKGEKVDGHDFVQMVLSKPVHSVVVRRGFIKASQISDSRLIEVEDLHQAHRLLASHFRKLFQGKVVAVGGSNGKTTTKEFIYTLLSASKKVVKTEKSQNGHLGIPKTMEMLRAGIDFAVIEVGIDSPGDMQQHADLVAPDYAVLTSIGEEHLNLFKKVETVFQEEKILFEKTWSLGGKCFAPTHDNWLAKLSHPNLIFIDTKNSKYSLQMGNDVAQKNAFFALGICENIGISSQILSQAMLNLKIPEGRGGVFHSYAGTVIDDCYNANPSSMIMSFKNAQRVAQENNKNLVFVLGDMFDLGEATEVAHASLVPHIQNAAPQKLVLVGPQMTKLATVLDKKIIKNIILYPDSDSAAAALRGNLSEKAVILVKGSNGMQLKKVVAILK